MPTFTEVQAGWESSYAQLLDRDGEVLHVRRVDMKTRRLDWISLKDISPALKKAVLFAEDRRFGEHHGVDWRALTAAALERLTGKGKRGASTISMQVVAMLDEKLAIRKGRRTVGQKLDQMQASMELEKTWTKEQILEAYLNLVVYRGELQGAASASQALFGKAASGLDDTEALLMAALLPSPQASAERLAARACRLAQAAQSGTGFETTCERIRARAAEALGRPPTAGPEPRLAPALAMKLLARPGERVRTTLDGGLQRVALEALVQQLRALSGRNVRHGAVLAVDNQTGEVLVQASASAEGAVELDGVSARRQAGSTLKPFLYGLALERELVTAASLLDDSPLQLTTATGLYIPQNYDRDFKGLVSVRTALASSLNIPAVRTLVLTGVETFHGRLRQLGYESLTEPGDYYGYSLALGSADVSLWEQVNAYRVLANEGLWSALRVTPGRQGEARRVMASEAAFIVGDILADRGARSLSFGLENPLATRFWSAVKTGTSKDMRDNWCIGYSSRYTVGVWVGNFDGEPMRGVSGITGAAPVWLEVMNAAHRGATPRAPSPPVRLLQARVAFPDGVEPPRSEWFLPGTEQGWVSPVSALEASARIVYPAQGTLIVLDPDIPPERQRLVFHAMPPLEGMQWELDGVPVADSAWQPVPGQHELVLRDSSGAEQDRVGFSVRGGTSARPGR